MKKTITVKNGSLILGQVVTTQLNDGIYCATIKNVDLQKNNDDDENPYTIIIGFDIYDEDGSSVYKKEYYSMGGKFTYKFESLYDSFKSVYQVNDETFDLDDLVDLNVYVTISRNGIYYNITYVDFNVEDEVEE